MADHIQSLRSPSNNGGMVVVSSKPSMLTFWGATVSTMQPALLRSWLRPSAVERRDVPEEVAEEAVGEAKAEGEITSKSKAMMLGTDTALPKNMPS